VRPFYRRVKLTEKKRRGRPAGQGTGATGQRAVSLNRDIHERFHAAYEIESGKYPFDLSIQQFFTVLLNLHEENQDDTSIG